jgi:N-dimethylarginine dimethylaminohydrolase
MKISSHNEWDKLRSVVVGSIEGANWPKADPTFAGNWDVTANLAIPEGPMAEVVINETIEDLNNFVATLTSAGVEVYRSKPHDFTKHISTTDWTSDQLYSYCPRDTHLVIGETVIETPMTNRARQMEAECLDHIRKPAMKAGVKWFSAPRPMLPDHCFEVVGDDTVLWEEEPIFDAANVMRLNDDILYLVSSTGNKAGAKWLQSVLPGYYTVHLMENVYNGSHLDTTIAPIREGLVVLSADRVNENNCPAIFKNWDKIWFQDPVPQSYYRFPFASKWMGLNLFMVDPYTAAVDSNQTWLISELEKHDVEVWPVNLRHSRTLGGGLHCTTLDLWRE